MQRFLGGRVAGVAASLIIIAGLVGFFRHVLRVNQTTVALSFLLVILAVSAVWGMAVSISMSVLAMLLFNYFFLPPVGTFTITDPQNWVALFAFLVTSITGSQLSSRIRKKADEAHLRRREIERCTASAVNCWPRAM
jgi:two-component system sensor histidine kinase KdpD